MKLVICGDIHIPNNKSGFINSDSFTEIFNTFNLIKETVYKYKPDYVVFLGDIFDVPHMITTSVISIVSELFSNLSIEVPIIFIAGNHDLVDDKVNNTKIGDYVISVKTSLILPFKNFSNVIVFDSPDVASLDNNLDVGFIPYSNNVVNSLKSIENKFTKGNKKLLLGHFDLQQSKYFSYDERSFVSLENIPSAKDLIKKYKYDLVLLGHIHEPIEYFIDSKLVKYIGSCRNINFSNINESKGLYVLDTKDLSLEFIENKHTCYYKTFRDFEALKDYCKESNPSKLAQTKIKYIYNNISELKKVSKLKEFFKSIQFEKSILTTDINGNKLELNADYFKEFSELIQSSTLTKEKLVDYSFQFSEPVKKDIAIKIFNMINS